MTRLTIALAGAIAAFVVWAWVRNRPVPMFRARNSWGTGWQEPEDGIQPWDTRTMTLVDPRWVDWRTGEWIEVHD